jgi:hypothetical protein
MGTKTVFLYFVLRISCIYYSVNYIVYLLYVNKDREVDCSPGVVLEMQ